MPRYSTPGLDEAELAHLNLELVLEPGQVELKVGSGHLLAGPRKIEP